MIQPKVKPFEMWFNKPVAVQLKVPYAVIVAGVDERRQPIRLQSGEQVYGQPALLEGDTPKGKQLILQQVLFGSLAASDFPTKLVLRTALPGGGIVAMMLDPDDIQYVSAITKVPEPIEPSRIVSPS